MRGFSSGSVYAAINTPSGGAIVVKTLSCAMAAALLTAVLCQGQALAQAGSFNKPLSEDRQIAHALNRITFGPRPGDVDTVRRIGLKQWIDLQLHPDRNPENPELIARLKPLDSLTMTPQELTKNYGNLMMTSSLVRVVTANGIAWGSSLRN